MTIPAQYMILNTIIGFFLRTNPKFGKSIFYIQKPTVFEYKKVDLSEFQD